jgi:hypothetical protein
VACPVAAHRSRSSPPRGQDFVGENDGMIEWSNMVGILPCWRLCRKINSRGRSCSTYSEVERSGGKVPLGSILSAMSASAVHNSVGRLWREIWEVGFTRSQLAHSIARENPARTLGRSIKRHVTHYIAHASIKKSRDIPDKVSSRLSVPQSHPPNTVPPRLSLPEATPRQSPPKLSPPKHPGKGLLPAFLPPSAPSASQSPPRHRSPPSQVPSTR